MMEGAFFVSKGVIIDWINELLDVSIISVFYQSVFIALTYQNRAMCDWSYLLPGY